MDNKGMSGIITAVIIIGIALAAIGIVWYVINTVAEEQTANVENASSQVYSSCTDAGYYLVDSDNSSIDECNQTVRYTGGQKCCTGPAS